MEVGLLKQLSLLMVDIFPDCTCQIRFMIFLFLLYFLKLVDKIQWLDETQI